MNTTVTPLVMPARKARGPVVPRMSAHVAARCAQGDKCTGAGCRVSTGKTDRARDARYPSGSNRAAVDMLNTF